MRRVEKGFTLIELLIAVAIVAIIAAIAYPSYMGTVSKSFRGEAQAHLMTLASDLERHFTLEDSYEDYVDPDDEGASELQPDGQLAERYDFSIDVDATTFTLTATPSALQADTQPCGALTLDEQGNKEEEDGNEECW